MVRNISKRSIDGLVIDIPRVASNRMHRASKQSMILASKERIVQMTKGSVQAFDERRLGPSTAD